jgi:hypothetical protein
MATVTIFEVIDTADGEVLRATHSSDRAHAWLDNERKESSLDMSVRTRVLEDVDPKHAALARHLDESPESVSECRYGDDMLECTGIPGEYRVLTEDERDTAARESLGIHSQGYDGDENEEQVDGEWLYIYRTN